MRNAIPFSSPSGGELFSRGRHVEDRGRNNLFRRGHVRHKHCQFYFIKYLFYFSNLLNNTPVHVSRAFASSAVASAHPPHLTLRFSSIKYTYPTLLFVIPSGSRTYSIFWLDTKYVGCSSFGTVPRRDPMKRETRNDFRMFSCRLICKY